METAAVLIGGLVGAFAGWVIPILLIALPTARLFASRGVEQRPGTLYTALATMVGTAVLTALVAILVAPPGKVNILGGSFWAMLIGAWLGHRHCRPISLNAKTVEPINYDRPPGVSDAEWAEAVAIAEADRRLP